MVRLKFCRRPSAGRHGSLKHRRICLLNVPFQWYVIRLSFPDPVPPPFQNFPVDPVRFNTLADLGQPFVSVYGNIEFCVGHFFLHPAFFFLLRQYTFSPPWLSFGQSYSLVFEIYFFSVQKDASCSADA